MAKLSSASIRLVQKMNRPNKHGEYPIYLVVCFYGRVEKATGVSCEKKYWDSKRECVKKGCANAPVLNKLLCDVLDRVNSRKNDFEYNGRAYTASMLLEDDVRVEFSARTNVYIRLQEQLLDERKLSYKSVKRYKYAYNKLVEYIGKKDFIVDEVNLSFVKGFAKSLSSKVCDGTIKDIFACVASVWNYAIDKGIVEGSGFPFKEFKFCQRFKRGNRTYFLDSSHIRKLMDYWLDLVIVRNGKLWSYKDGAEDRLMKRTSEEWCLLWFLLMYKLNGSAPIEIALLKSDNCKRIKINNEDYWAIDFKRQKTKRDVHVRWKRDMFAVIGLEHFLGKSRDGIVYPICTKLDTEENMIQQSHRLGGIAIKHLRNAFEKINAETIKSNVENGVNEPLVDVASVVLYTARHTAANHLLNTPNVTVSELATILARSPNTISTYIHELNNDEEIVNITKNMPI